MSDDHAHERFCAEGLSLPASASPRVITHDEVRQHNGRGGENFWAVVDGYVVDATDMVNSHLGGLKKLLTTDAPGVGASGKAFGFSFTRGRNAHFPETGKSFHEGVQRFLNGRGEPFFASRRGDLLFARQDRHTGPIAVMIDDAQAR